MILGVIFDFFRLKNSCFQNIIVFKINNISWVVEYSTPQEGFTHYKVFHESIEINFSVKYRAFPFKPVKRCKILRCVHARICRDIFHKKTGFI